MKYSATLLGTFLLAGSSLLWADSFAPLRYGHEIDQQKTNPEVIRNLVNEDIKSKRNYPMQPPLIPHKIRDYELNLRVNKCMSCHSRKRTEKSQAPMISVTHYMDRDGNFLANLSPRRYFCMQCHVPQHEGAPVVENTFVDMDVILEEMSRTKR